MPDRPEWASTTANMKRADLKTTDEHFEALWDVAGKARSTTKAVSVPKDALMALLMDHSRFYAQVFDRFPSRQKVPAKKA